MNINEALISVLHVAHEHRWVSDFLFGDLLQTPFHRDVPLAPTMFVDALTTDLRVRIKLWPDVPDQPSLPKSLANDMPPSGIDDTLLHTAFVPVAVVGTLAVGYAFAAHKIPRDQCMPHNPLVPPFVARFVLDFRDDNLVFINRGGKPPCIGVRAMRCSPVDRTVREHYSFIIPDAPYTWPHLPKTAIWMLSHSEKYVTPSGYGHSFQNSVISHADVRSTPDCTPWSILRNGTLGDGMLPSFGPVDDPTSATISTSFSISRRAAAASALRGFLSGSFQASAFRIDSFNAMTGTVNTCFTGPVISNHAPTAVEISRVLTQRFVHAYYTDILAVTCDKALSPTPTTSLQQVYGNRKHATSENSPVSTSSKTRNPENQSESSEFWRTLLVNAHNYGVQQNTSCVTVDEFIGLENPHMFEFAHNLSNVEQKVSSPRTSLKLGLNAYPEFGAVSAGNSVLGGSTDFGPPYGKADDDKTNAFSWDAEKLKTTSTDGSVSDVITAEGDELVGLIDKIIDGESNVLDNSVIDIYQSDIASNDKSNLSNASKPCTELCTEFTNNANFPSPFDPLGPPLKSLVNDLLIVPDQNHSTVENTKTKSSDAIIPDITSNALTTTQTTKHQPRRTQAIFPRSTPISLVPVPQTTRNKEQVLADRKRRNRLSAARSNERRRLWEAQLGRDLQTERERMAELKARLKVVHNENDTLRQQLQGLEKSTEGSI